MKLWIDDVRPAPEGYIWARSTDEAILIIDSYRRWLDYLAYRVDEPQTFPWFEVIDIDHDAGDYASDGGDYIKLLDWLEETGRTCTVRIHSMNPVGRENMRRIIEKNGWKESR